MLTEAKLCNSHWERKAGGEVRLHAENGFWRKSNIHIVEEEEVYPIRGRNLLWKCASYHWSSVWRLIVGWAVARVLKRENKLWRIGTSDTQQCVGRSTNFVARSTWVRIFTHYLTMPPFFIGLVPSSVKWTQHPQSCAKWDNTEVFQEPPQD